MTSASLAEGAYERLRHAFVQGDLRPGQTVVEADLASLLKMSRTPVREALLRLELEGYLERDASSRLVVHPLTKCEVAETFMVRQLLECHAIRLAALRISDDELARLDELVSADRRALRRRRLDELARLNEEIHDAVMVASRNRTLSELVGNLRARVYGLNAFVYGSTADQERFVEEHAEMVRLLRAGDDEAAVQALGHHLAYARDLILRGLEDTVSAPGGGQEEARAVGEMAERRDEEPVRVPAAPLTAASILGGGIDGREHD